MRKSSTFYQSFIFYSTLLDYVLIDLDLEGTAMLFQNVKVKKSVTHAEDREFDPQQNFAAILLPVL